MASLVLGAAGAIVGSFFGPLGTSIGWSLGSALGGYLSQPNQEGPRLTDLKVQTSAYGAAIPIGFGTIRISSNVIWSTDLQEQKNTSGGKGGPEITTYTYSASFACSLVSTSYVNGDGDVVNRPILGINRIWADGRLIFGEGSPGDAFPMTTYYGEEDQLADPTMEAIEGVGNVPGYRGLAYVVFTDLPLEQFFNRLPNLTFEVICDGEFELSYRANWPVDYDWPVNQSTYSYPYQLNGIESPGDGTLVMHRYRSGANYGTEMGTGDDNIVYYDQTIFDMEGNVISAAPQVINTASGAIGVLGSLNSGVAYASWHETVDCTAVGGDQYTTANTFAWLKNGVPTGGPSGLQLCAAAVGGVVTIQLPIEAGPVYWNGNIYASGKEVGGEMRIRRWPAPDGAVRVIDPEIVGLNADLYSAIIADAGDIIIGDDGYLYWLVGYFAGAGDGIRLFKMDASLNYITHWATSGVSPEPLPTPGYGSSVIWRRHLVYYHSSGGINKFKMIRLNADGTADFVDDVVVRGVWNGDAPKTYNDVGPLHYIGGNRAAYRGGILQLGTTGVQLWEIVKDISDRVGYSSAQYDVTELIDWVKGYTIGNRMSGRAAVDPLRPAYQFGAVESNLKVKFRKWQGYPDATIPDEDLGARPADDDPVDPFETTRIQEEDLPMQVDFVYSNFGADYQEGTQIAQRESAPSGLKVTVSAPIVLDDTEARKMADVLLYNAWVERERFKFSLPRRWSHIEPTDVIATRGRAVRIVNKEEVGYTHIAFEGIATGTGVFVTAPTPAPPIGFVPQPVPVPNHTDLRMLDLPLIADTDSPNGYYAAVAGRMAGSWPGATLYKSIDGGVNYSAIGAASTNNAIGSATTALGDFTGGNVFDEASTVTVRLTPGSPDLVSSNSLGVLNGANMARLGSEVLQFKTATLVSTSVYTLSGFLRGRRGTEWAIGTHVQGDSFVLLPAINVAGPGSELGQERLFKAITTGQPLSSESAVAFTNTGVALLPYAPALVGGGRNAAGDLTINWTRRTRIGGSWLDNVDVPLSEASEWYLVTIYTDGLYSSVERVGLAYSETFSYTAADQTDDQGSPQATVYVGIQQGGAYGPGYQARAAL